ncbi:MAG TPA: PQQ-binding-like beta-propeller repeat protein [Nitrososphaerales archaeon]|nr:PQQ-binding-like beta-propeller repeat protein [Nitrososphaerales archaeon]
MKTSLVVAAVVAVVLILAGSLYVALPALLGTTASTTPGGASASVSVSASASGTVRSSSSSASSVSSTSEEDWTTYHADNARTGYVQVANFTAVKQGWTSPALDGIVFTEPLVYQGDVFVATENNSVYALNSGTGAVVWRTNLGPPVQAGTLPCGNIGPVTGITGTPVIDPSTGTIYVVAYTGGHHMLDALKTSTGAVVFERSASPPGFNDTTQQQRTALTLANGMVYFEYGGLAGDCNLYHGWVVGIPASGTGAMASYEVPTQNEGGIWAPSGASVDSAGDVYVASGNGASTSTYDHGDSVIKLSPSLTELQYFAPTNWARLNQDDTDISSLGPAFVGPDTIFQIGKEGVGYLLNSSQLGGIGGQEFSAQVCNESFGGSAFAAPYIYVPCIEGLYILKLNPGNFTTKVEISGFNSASPIVTGGVVWTIDTNTATLYGLSATTGHQVYAFNLGSVEHFTTPSAGDGQLFVSAANQVESFVLG